MKDPAIHRTPLSLVPADSRIQSGQSILALGSCFAERMGERLAAAQFPVSINPLGIAFHPLALATLIDRAIKHNWQMEPEFADHLQSWHSFSLHSRFLTPSKADFSQQVQQQGAEMTAFIQEADWLLLTFGTAIVYRHVEREYLVNNCHKYPANTFQKETLDLSSMLDVWQPLLTELFEHNPRLKVVLTVSPIRHIKEGLPENSHSKAILRVVCAELSKDFPQLQYFPAYEIMMDDLRDYRYYKADMIHPTEQAQTYIWQTFQETLFHPTAQHQVRSWDRIAAGLAHRPLIPWSDSYRDFLVDLLGKVQAFSETFEVDCTQEREKIEAWIEDFSSR